MTDAEKIQFIVGYYGLENQLVQTAEEDVELVINEKLDRQMERIKTVSEK